MIRGITVGPGLNISGGTPSTTYINNYNGMPGVGNMRYNPSSNNIEVFDGMNWQMLQTTYASVELDSETRSLLEWARNRRAREQEMERMVRDYPALADAKEAVDRAQEQLEMLAVLARDDKLNASR